MLPQTSEQTHLNVEILMQTNHFSKQMLPCPAETVDDLLHRLAGGYLLKKGPHETFHVLQKSLIRFLTFSKLFKNCKYSNRKFEN